MKKAIRKAGALVLMACLILSAVAGFSGCAGIKGEMIGEERAFELAIEYFGLEKGDCKVRKILLDDGRYDVEFVCADKEYDVEIDAFSGKIWERDVEYNDDFIGAAPDDTTKPSDSTDTMISADRAKEIAIEYFSLNASECSFVRAELEGRKYEIEFVFNGKEYETEVDAYTGRVIDADVDVFD